MERQTDNDTVPDTESRWHIASVPWSAERSPFPGERELDFRSSTRLAGAMQNRATAPTGLPCERASEGSCPWPVLKWPIECPHRIPFLYHLTFPSSPFFPFLHFPHRLRSRMCQVGHRDATVSLSAPIALLSQRRRRQLHSVSSASSLRFLLYFLSTPRDRLVSSGDEMTRYAE